MNFRLTAILLVVLLAVAAVAYYVNQQAEATPKPGEEPELLLYQEKADDVTNVEIRTKDKTVALERSGDHWRLKQPEAADADPYTAQGIATQLSTIRAARRIGDTSDLTQYGLDQPTYTVTVQFKDGHTRHLLLGKDNPLGNGSYAKLPDSPIVYLLEEPVPTIHAAITTPPKAQPTPSPAPSAPIPTVSATPTP